MQSSEFIYIFKEEKEDSLALSLKYNVHKNLGECYLQDGDISLAQEEMLTATELDAGDVTLWFKIAGINKYIIKELQKKK
jgi:hypothetical protein